MGSEMCIRDRFGGVCLMGDRLNELSDKTKESVSEERMMTVSSN